MRRAANLTNSGEASPCKLVDACSTSSSRRILFMYTVRHVRYLLSLHVECLLRPGKRRLLLRNFIFLLSAPPYPYAPYGLIPHQLQSDRNLLPTVKRTRILWTNLEAKHVSSCPTNPDLIRPSAQASLSLGPLQIQFSCRLSARKRRFCYTGLR